MTSNVRPLATSIQPTDVVVLLPVYNDWVACSEVVARLDDLLRDVPARVSILIVDDGSTEDHLNREAPVKYETLQGLFHLRLRRNLGHQRAICIGLAFLEQNVDCKAVVVMDADGEDSPADVPRLIERWAQTGGTEVVFAERMRRSEGLVFRISYALYRGVHRILTGRNVRVGNFSIVPRELLARLVVTPELWSHYAAAVFLSKVAIASIPTARAARIAGRSAMNYPALVTHGLSAISVFSEIVSVRLLLASLSAMLIALIGITSVIVVRFLGDLTIPGWASLSVGFFVLLFGQAIQFSFLLTVGVLANRKGASMLPVRDYHYFVDSLSRADARE